MVDALQGAVVAVHDKSVVETFISMVTVLATFRHRAKVSSHVDVILSGQTAQPGLDVTVSSRVYIAGVGPVSL